MSADNQGGEVNRREFIARSVGGFALTVLTACGDGPTIPSSPRLEIKVADFPGLATIGQVVKVGSSHAAKRTGAGTFEAYSMFCTHQGCLTSLSSQQFFCPCHGSKFSADGSVVQGPADKSLASLATSYNAATDTLTIN
jgi:cytochrome b6-f complex iron-sulfur subunit